VLLPKLPAPFHHGQDSCVVGSLVAGLEHTHIPPTACGCHIGVREMFPRRYPGPAIRMPEASVLLWHPCQSLGPLEPRRRQVLGRTLLGVPARREQEGPADPRVFREDAVERGGVVRECAAGNVQGLLPTVVR